MSLKIQDDINPLIKSIHIYGNLFINSTSELRIDNSGDTPREYYIINYTSLENLSVTSSRIAYETLGRGWHEELSPAIVAAFLRRTETTGEIMEITGHKIARVEYNTEGGYTEDLVFSDNLDQVIRSRVKEMGILPITAGPAQA